MRLYTYEEYSTQHGWINSPIENGSTLSSGDLTEAPFQEDFDPEKIEDKEKYYLMPKLLSGGDYVSSCLFEVSNHRVFLKDYKEIPGVFNVQGGFGAFAIAIRLDVYLSNQEIREIIDNLDYYPLIDEDDLSELKFEKENQAWDNWTKDDALEALRESHPSLENIEEPENFYRQFNLAAAEINEYWENENSDTMYINIKNIIPTLRDRFLVIITPYDDLPLLAGHKWVSDEALSNFEKRLRGEELEEPWKL